MVLRKSASQSQVKINTHSSKIRIVYWTFWSYVSQFEVRMSIQYTRKRIILFIEHLGNKYVSRLQYLLFSDRSILRFENLIYFP